MYEVLTSSEEPHRRHLLFIKRIIFHYADLILSFLTLPTVQQKFNNVSRLLEKLEAMSDVIMMQLR